MKKSIEINDIETTSTGWRDRTSFTYNGVEYLRDYHYDDYGTDEVYWFDDFKNEVDIPWLNDDDEDLLTSMIERKQAEIFKDKLNKIKLD